MGLEQRQVPCPRNVDEAQNNRDRELSLCLPALLGWACREMLLSPSRLGEERSAKGGALSCQAHGGCIHLAYATGQSVGSGILMIRAARRCEARAGKTQTRQKNEKKPPEGGFVYPVKRAP